jgi:hypothetical protein
MATGFEFDNTTGRMTWQGLEIPLGGVNVSLPYVCPVGVAVGEAVFLDSADAVDQAASTVVSDRPCIGIVRSKPTPTSCVVQYSGELSVFGGLTPAATYYLSSTAGTITATPPSASGEIVQEVGWARNATTLVIGITRDFTLLA